MSNKIWTAITRKKRVEDNVHKLERILTLKDLVVLGVGSTLGLGAYVLAANIAKNDAGPAACLSYVFAAISAAISGETKTISLKYIYLIDFPTGIAIGIFFSII